MYNRIILKKSPQESHDLTAPWHGLLAGSQGGLDAKDGSLADAACREAAEEAGVRGSVSALAGRFKYQQQGQRCEATVFVLEVAEELTCWKEAKRRERKWVSLAAAKRLAKHPWMTEALEQPAVAFLSVDLALMKA